MTWGPTTGQVESWNNQPSAQNHAVAIHAKLSFSLYLLHHEINGRICRLGFAYARSVFTCFMRLKEGLAYNCPSTFKPSWVWGNSRLCRTRSRTFVAIVHDECCHRSRWMSLAIAHCWWGCTFVNLSRPMVLRTSERKLSWNVAGHRGWRTQNYYPSCK